MVAADVGFHIVAQVADKGAELGKQSDGDDLDLAIRLR